MNRCAKGLMAVAGLGLLAGCGGGDDDLLPRAEVRALHGSPDAPNVDIYINGVLELENISYQQASSNLRVLPGEYLVEVNETGTDDTVLSDTFVLERDDLVTLIASGEAESIDYLAVPEDGSRVTSGKARVNVVHASPNAGTVDIYVSAYGDPLPGTPTIDNVAFEQSMTLGEVDVGTYQVRITGSTDTDVVFDSGPLELTNRANLTAVAVDSDEDGDWAPVELVLLTGSADNPVVQDDTTFVRVVHGVPGQTVDVYVNGALTLEDFEYKENTGGYVDLNSMPQLDITAPNDAIGNAVLSAQPTLDRGAYYTVIANGTIDGNDNIPLSFFVLQDNLTPPTATNALLRIAHAAPFAEGDGADVDVYATESGNSEAADIGALMTVTLATDLGYQEDTGYLSVDADSYSALVTAADSTTVAIGADVTLNDVQPYTVIAVGGANSEPLELLVLLDAED